jgi:hypothetical protein
MMDFWDYTILLLPVVGLVYLLWKASASRENKKRIVDLLIIGVILFVAPQLGAHAREDPLKVAGTLIFAYGWGILVVEKFCAGLRGKD